MTPTQRERAERALDRGWLGDFEESLGLIPGLLDGDEEGRAFSLLLQTQLWFADPTRGALPSPRELTSFSSADTPAKNVAWAAAALAARAAVLSRSHVEVMAAADLVATLGPPDNTILAWAALGAGDAGRGLELLQRDKDETAHRRIERVSLQSLCCLELRRIDEGVQLARQSSRMANTEGQPQAQYLAHLTLARARRLSGHPHLAVRILHAMRRVAPVSWRRCIDWELAACGLVAEAAEFSSVMIAVEAQDIARINACVTRAQEQAGTWAPYASELEAWLAFVVPGTPTEALHPAVQSFLAGHSNVIPAVLAGLAVSPSQEEVGGPVVLIRPDGLQERFAAAAAPWIAVHLGTSYQADKAGRTELALSILALAGAEGLEEPELFRRAYGFSFRPDVHRGAFKTLKHRMRRWCEGHGAVEQLGDRLLLRLDHPVMFLDPRCEEPLSERMLRFLAAGGGTVKDTARRLGVTERTVQRALKDLSEDGAVEAHREGRKVTYSVQDTTFYEPTMWR